MRTLRYLSRLLLAALLGLAMPVLAEPSPAPANALTASGESDTRRIMVMLELGADHYRAGGDYGGTYGDTLGEQARLRVARRIAREHGLTVLESWPMKTVGVDCIIMAINDDRPLSVVVAELSALPGVAWSQPLNEFRMQGAAQTPAHAAAPARYNDRLFAAQPASFRWHLASLHRYATGRGETIAIIDSRVDTSHPDLAGQITSSSDFVVPARRAVERHGTGVAGIIAARANNAMGIAGVAPGARILALRACWERPLGGTTVCDTLSLAKALTFALENHADVINLSLTGPQDRLLQTLIGIGIQRGITVVAAVDAGNPSASFPAFVSGVIPVADQRLSAGAPAVYIAPGRDVPTTQPEGKWSIVNGSSFAAAHVSGLAALLRQLSGPDSHRTPASTWLGPRGVVDACSAIARMSLLDATACENGH